MRIDWNAERELLVPNLNGGRGQVAARLCPLDCGKALWSRLPAGASIGEHRHETSTDVNFVLAGRGRAVTDGVPEPIAPRRLPRLQKGLHPRHRKHRGRGPRAAHGRLRTRKGRLGKGCDE